MNLSRKFLLNAFLIYSAIVWLVCLAGIFVPGVTAFNLLSYIGGVEPDLLCSDPIYAYWLRMASSVFAFIGVLFLLPVFRPEKFQPLLPVLGIFMVVEGLILMVHGLMLKMPVTPMWSDVGVCLVGGIGILLSLRKNKTQTEAQRHKECKSFY